MTQEQKQIQENTLRIQDLRAVNWLFFTFIITSVVFFTYRDYKQEHRLNEHKRIIIEQQKQINQLIRYERVKIYNK